VETVTVSLLPI